MSATENHTAQKTLLEPARLAAGILCSWDYNRGYTIAGEVRNWNPLANSTDALELASKLCMSICVDETGSRAWMGEHSADGTGIAEPYAALRLAIVRLAGKIGKQ